MKKIILLFFVFGTYSIIAQNYQAIDYFIKKNIPIVDYTEQGEFERLNLLLSIDDCDKCIPQLHSYLSQIDSVPPFTINVITNNLAFAKKTLGNTSFKYHLYLNREIFTTYLAGSSGLYYEDMSHSLYTKEKDIRTKIKNAKERIDHLNNFTDHNDYFLAQDELMTEAPYINVSTLTNDRLFLYDHKVNTGLVLHLQTKNDSIYSTYHRYYTPRIKNPKKLYNLPFNGHNLLSFEDTQKQLALDHIEFINMYSLNHWESTYYVVFGITRMMKNENLNTFSYYPEYFIATKKNDQEDIESLLDLSSYTHYYKIDQLKYKDFTGTIILHITDKPYFRSKNQLTWRARIQPEGEIKMNYLGLATVELKNDTVHIISIDEEFEEFTDNNTLFTFKNKNYYLTKNTYNESAAEVFELKEFKQGYTDCFLERLIVK